jgi:hypothetical protein
MLLFQLSGSFLLRYAQRELFRLLFHDPPRNTRWSLACPHSNDGLIRRCRLI